MKSETMRNIDQEIKEMQEQWKKEDDQEIKEMKQKGFTNKLTYRIHNTGDDKTYSIFKKGRFTTNEISKYMKNSVVKNDFIQIRI